MTGWPDQPVIYEIGTAVWLHERDGAELASPGMFVDLEPWQFRLLALQ